MSIGLVHDPIFLKHDTGPYHCETSERLDAIDYEVRRWRGLGDIQPIAIRPAEESELVRVHQPSHVHRIAGTEGKEAYLDPDTVASPYSFEAALKGVGGLLNLCDAALAGEIKHGMALVRPPGHHATPTRAMGFCLFNNVAVAAAHLLRKQGLKRILVVDWDVHHGNGTEDIFYNDPQVLYFSTHQAPFYPGTGAATATGAEEGLGYTVNVPLRGGHGDLEYIRIFEDLLLPVARQFDPQFILVSAGYDAHREDPLGGMRLSAEGYAALTQILVELASDFCPGRVILALEGGYAPQALARSVVACLEALDGTWTDNLRRLAKDCVLNAEFDKIMDVHARHWHLGKD